MLSVVDAYTVNELARAKIPQIYFFTVWLRKALRDLPELVGDDEELLTLAKASYESRSGVLAVTDKRAIVVVGSPVQRRVKSLPLNQVTSVRSKRGLFSGRVMIAVAGNEAVIRSIFPKARADEINDVVRSNLVAPTAMSQRSEVPAARSRAEDLARLAKLRDSGVLSDAEFEDQKRKLFDSASTGLREGARASTECRTR
jgi:hypothetical protein